MLFNSPEFLVFLPLVFAAYWLLRRRLHIQNLLIVAASYLFYGWWDWRFLVLIAVTSAWSFLIGCLEARRWNSPGSKTLLTLSLAVNLGILGYFKYFGFFVGQFSGLLCRLGFDPHVSSLKIILPVGISFYTFQALSYSIDVYRRRVTPTLNPVTFFAYISFFPQLVAGPIERAANLLPQFSRHRAFDYAEAVLGCRQMLWGFFKKCVVADNCAVVVDHLLNSPAPCGNGLAGWLGAVLFSLQIYGDFSGYSDIAIGASRLLGFRLMRNFAFPFFARDIAEFWRRWHISLTTWFRDYLYIPLGGSRCPVWKQVRNTMLVFLVSGLWHGANWTFLAWGFFHGLLFLPLLLRGTNRRHLGVTAETTVLPGGRELLSMLFTFVLVTLGFALFRAPSVSVCAHWLLQMFNPLRWGTPGHLPRELWTALPAAAVMFAVEWINRRADFGFAAQPPWKALRWAGYFVLLWLCVFFTPGSQSFIYFRF